MFWSSTEFSEFFLVFDVLIFVVLTISQRNVIFFRWILIRRNIGFEVLLLSWRPDYDCLLPLPSFQLSSSSLSSTSAASAASAASSTSTTSSASAASLTSTTSSTSSTSASSLTSSLSSTSEGYHLWKLLAFHLRRVAAWSNPAPMESKLDFLKWLLSNILKLLKYVHQ